MVKEEKPNVEGGAKPKGRPSKQSNSNQKSIFKLPKIRLEDKVLNIKKLKYAADLLKNCEAIDKYITVKSKHRSTEMSMDTKKMEKPMINVTEVTKDTSSWLENIAWENKWKESKRKDTIFEGNNNKTYSLLLLHCTQELEVKIKVMGPHDAIKMDQEYIELSKLIRIMCHLQDDNKQDIMPAV